MKISVVTSYYDASDKALKECHQSVVSQTTPVHHVLVADGEPHGAPDKWEADHIVLPRPHKDYGDCGRLIGAIHAISEGADCIAFLDVDNTYLPNHIETLEKKRIETGADFLISGRYLCRIDGSIMRPCPRSIDGSFADTNTMYFTRNSFPVLFASVLAGRQFSAIGDRILYNEVKQRNLTIAVTGQPTVNYICNRALDYTSFDETPPEGAIPNNEDIRTARRLWQEAGNEDLG